MVDGVGFQGFMHVNAIMDSGDSGGGAIARTTNGGSTNVIVGVNSIGTTTGTLLAKGTTLFKCYNPQSSYK